ncbi:MAG: 4-alpha-glucanotransferase [Micrococcales bacterium]|nr:4-alpha-glucanotransferase [Micrococcales bacterium]
MSQSDSARARFVATVTGSPPPSAVFDQLAKLASLNGVTTEYTDWKGNPQRVAAKTIRAVLAALGLEVGTDEAVLKALKLAQVAKSRAVIAPATVMRVGQLGEVAVHLAPGTSAEAWLELDQDPLLGSQGGLVDLAFTDDGGHLVLPEDLPLGWHTIRLRIVSDSPANSSQEAQTKPDHQAKLVICPDRLDLPPHLEPTSEWGPMVQLYSLRSQLSWGLGDFIDLGALGHEMARLHGADFVLINPIHAAEPTPPITDSPYLPTTRDFVNPIYIRPEATAEYAAAGPAVRQNVDQLQVLAAAGSDTATTLERDAAWTLKLRALELLCDVPRSPDRLQAIEDFASQAGSGLNDFALWSALAEAGLASQIEYDSAEAGEFAKTHQARLDFHVWLQFLADEQLAIAQAACLEGGMKLGVIKDLAVGVHPHGSDAWSRAKLLAKGIEAGAPPDYFNQVGQGWSEPPWRPDALAAAGYGPLRSMLRAMLRHAGGLRIDHILGLFRLWWIPLGMEPGDGTYVAYDHEAMASILVLEAHRAGAVLVGEDLGVVAPGVREYLKSRGILGTSIAWFEREGDGPNKLPPSQYRRLAMTALTTHDLPPTSAYLAGEHINQRQSLGLLDMPLDQALAGAALDRSTMVDLLVSEGFLEDREQDDDPSVVLALHKMLRSMPSVLLGVSLADMVGDRRSQNVPGTDREYPNWSVPLADAEGQAVFLEELETNATFGAIAQVMRAK